MPWPCFAFNSHRGKDNELPRLLADCEAAFDSMAHILNQLRQLSHYSSEAYLSPPSGTSGTSVRPDFRILTV